MKLSDEVYMEPDTATACFTSDITQPLNRDAIFEISLSNVTTASIQLDFDPEFDFHFLTIQTGFNGLYEMCVNISILEDDERIIEVDETIVYDVIPLSELDRVNFPRNLSSIKVVIAGKNSHILKACSTALQFITYCTNLFCYC